MTLGVSFIETFVPVGSTDYVVRHRIRKRSSFLRTLHRVDINPSTTSALRLRRRTSCKVLDEFFPSSPRYEQDFS